jgi:hypothetical protein
MTTGFFIGIRTAIGSTRRIFICFSRAEASETRGAMA